MPFHSETLADRVRRILNEKEVPFMEQVMVGGISFLVRDKMCLGVIKDDLMVRVGPDAYEHALKQPGCRPMDFTGSPIKGYVFVGPEVNGDDGVLGYWIDRALAYIPHAGKSQFLTFLVVE